MSETTIFDVIDGLLQPVEHITAESKISYSVILEIKRFDKVGNGKQLVYTKRAFSLPFAFTARKQAFDYADQFLKDALVDGKLCDGHIDHKCEPEITGVKDVTCMWITINCIDEVSGEELPISLGNWDNPSIDDLEGMHYEFSLYQDYGYGTNGLPNLTKIGNTIYKSINLGTAKELEKLYYVVALNVSNKIKLHGIYADRDGYIRLLTTDEISDNVAIEQLKISGKYAVNEVSILGIKSAIELDETGHQTAKYQRRIYQSFIEPEHLIAGRIYDTNEFKHYIDYWENTPLTIRAAS